MLVLRRKQGEKLIIYVHGEKIVVQILHSDRDDRSVQVGIQAPKHVNVIREEADTRGGRNE
jgi:carbon storage regulator CsrA